MRVAAEAVPSVAAARHNRARVARRFRVRARKAARMWSSEVIGSGICTL